jgi:tetratricopeptide (TPR) repeat protein
MAEGDRGGSHPSPAELDRFLLGKASPRQAVSIVAHLVRGCEACRQRMAPLTSVVFASGPLAPPASPSSGQEYDFPLFKAFAAARQYAESRALGEANARRRPSRTFPQEAPRLAASSASERDRDWDRCEALVERCRSLSLFDDLEGALLTASLATRLAERLEARPGRSDRLADLQARAWAELGNVTRVADDLSVAEAALARALDLSACGTGDPRLLARIMDLTASLYTDQRRFAEARRLLDGVYTIYHRLGDTHSAARALISKGISAGAALQSEEAVGLLQRGICLADAAREPRLIFQAVHSLLWGLLDCGNVAEVEKLWDQVQELYSVYAEGAVALREQWLEGRVAAGLGKDERAERVFLRVRRGFREAERHYDAALVSLDLAAVWLRQGRTTEILESVEEMIAIFRSLDIQREALAALLMLRGALEKDQATAALLQAVSAEIRRLERQPKRHGRAGSGEL